MGSVFCLLLALQDDGIDFFEKRIRPVLADRCYGCHSAKAEKLKGALLLDTREGLLKGGSEGPALVPGVPDRSLLIRAIRYTDEKIQMPPKKRLMADQVADFEAWVRKGAPDPRTSSPAKPAVDPARHWAFLPLQKVVPPNSPSGNEIDGFIQAKLQEKGLRPAPPADKRSLIRRATFDLIGLPPTPEEIDAFLVDDSAEAFGRVVDRLLASPHYGERWGRHWLDVARFSDTKGYVQMPEERRFVNAPAYRDWVIRAFNDDLPYDRFLVQQIAADQLPSGGDPAALGFLTVGRRFKNMIHDIIDDRIDTLTRATMGLTVGCARCHDHKFDPIPIQDYYSLYAVFAGGSQRTVPLSGGAAASPTRAAFEEELKKRQKALRTSFESIRKRIEDRHRSKVAEYLAAVVDVDRLPPEDVFILQGDQVLNPVVVRRWHTYLLRRGPSDPVFGPWHALAAKTSVPTDGLNKRVAQAFSDSPPTSLHEAARRYGDLFARVKSSAPLPDPADEELRRVLYGDDSPVKVPSGSVLDAEYYLDWPLREELLKLEGRIDRWILEAEGAVPHAVVLDEPAARPSARVFRRGNPAEKGEEVPCRFLGCVSGGRREPFQEGRARLDLAESIVSRDNPLTARVLVNRLWLHHFGEGLVRTPSDFGLRSDPPTHPELLEWMARRFIDGGFSVKRIHRLLMLSGTYRQGCEGDPEGRRIDPSNLLVGRMNRRRLDFEELRDALLAVSGELDPTLGGRAVNLTTRPFNPRRSVYGLIDRLNLPSVYRVFDFPSPDAHSPRRVTTTTAPQALFLMNSPFVQERAQRLAARPEVGAQAQPADRVRNLYRLVYGRSPTAEEVAWGIEFVQAQPEPIPATPGPWRYGFGEFDDQAKRLKEFRPLPWFTGSVWHSGPTNLLISPSPQMKDVNNGWPTLSAEGGHPGNDRRMAVVRRWIAPSGGKIEIEGKPPAKGAWIVSSRAGTLASEKGAAEVEAGDTIDFVLDGRTAAAEEAFVWSPKIRLTEGSGAVRKWDAARDFGGPPAPALDAWAKFAQALLLANEFVFVD